MKSSGTASPQERERRAVREGDPCRDSWRHRLSFKLIVGLMMFFFLFSLSAYLAMRLRGREVIRQNSDRLTHEVGRKLVLRLQEHIEASEALARTLATLGESLPRDEAIFKKLLPDVLNLENKRDLIAGGGIWPEPGKFVESAARRSFFWGRNPAGWLEYFDDYNAPTGPGYHNEEWYEPARHLRPGSVYWSRSYMDPYSFEPMVTCTVPMWRAGAFSGVATVDLKLTGLAAIMRELARETGGYAFVVDRNNTFICFPDPAIASRTKTNAEGKRVQEQRDAAGVAAERKEFAPVAALFEAMDRDARERTTASGESGIDEMARVIQSRILDIGPDEALRIAIGLRVNEQPDAAPRGVETINDVVMSERVQMLVYEMPSTHWKVALAMPVRKTQAVVDTVLRRVAVFLLVVSSLLCVGAWLFFNRTFLRPLAALTRQLRLLADAGNHHAHLPVSGRDELARLAYWFNVRTGMLEQAYLDLKDKNLQLDEARLTAESADRSKNIFLASMSHELRTPLNAIIGMSSFMQNTRLDAEQSEYARTIHSSSNALLDLVNDIMDFSKIEAGQLELEANDFDLRTILDEVTDMLAYAATEKGLHFTCLLDPASDGRVRGDSGRIRQIIANLGANAVKFTSEGSVEMSGRIVDDGSPKGLRFEFSVHDTGVGIPSDARERLFKPYSQVINSTTRQFGGTGLGLAICKRLCALMQGDIDFESRPDEGTTFRFHIRLGVPGKDAQPGIAPRIPRLGEWQCLVVEPQAKYGDLLRRQLTAWGIPAVHVASPDDAPARLREFSSKSILIVSGIDERAFPGTGLRLREAAGARATRVILHVQSSLGEKRAELVRHGYDACVPKPLRIGQLAGAIENAMAAPVTDAGTAPAPAGTGTGQTGKFILVAEDNPLNQKVVCRMLKNLGHRYDLAENGVRAIELVTQKHYDLVLMDWHMPEMDGLEATQHIRKMGGRFADLPIIALTASALQNERQQCFVAGMNDYLSKPVTEKNLQSTLQKWVGQVPVT